MSGFVRVEKNGEVIEVHPDALENHKQLGWKVCADVPVVKADEVEKPAEKPAPKKAGK